jgi:tetratricopeptide (TPR) repeat protein
MKYSLILGCTLALVSFADVAVAKTRAELFEITRSAAVEIKLQKSGRVGSGVIIHHQGDIYTLATNRHVICGSLSCKTPPTGEIYSLELADGQQYPLTGTAVKLVGNNLDLAIIKFRSKRKYPVIPVAAPGSLKVAAPVYTAGFPSGKKGFYFGYGQAIAIVNKRLIGDSGGYTIIHNAYTLPGMSGSGIFDSNGQLVAIHGWGDRYKSDTDPTDRSKIDTKTGYNRGIPVRWLVQGCSELGINLVSNRSLSEISVVRQVAPSSADEHFIAGFNKLVEPGTDVDAGKRQAIQEFSAAIRLNPKYAVAYSVRGYLYNQLKDFEQAINDYTSAIILDPDLVGAYNNRGVLKSNRNDLLAALSDYNQAILIDPKFASAFNNRGLLKSEKLNDLTGALADFNRAIELNPEEPSAYNNRGSLKSKSNDLSGALSDYNQAINLYPQYADAYTNRANLKYRQNNLVGALADYDQAVAMNPKDVLIYTNRGYVKYKLKDFSGALQDFDRAIAINPKYADTYLARGNLKDQMNKLSDALLDYSQAISFKPDYALAYYNRGVLKNKMKDRPGAIADLRQAARYYREQKQTKDLQDAIDALGELGAKE